MNIVDRLSQTPLSVSSHNKDGSESGTPVSPVQVDPLVVQGQTLVLLDYQTRMLTRRFGQTNGSGQKP
jgi:hypothetical protein